MSLEARLARLEALLPPPEPEPLPLSEEEWHALDAIMATMDGEGLTLACLNLNRGRDVRELFGLPRAEPVDGAELERRHALALRVAGFADE